MALSRRRTKWILFTALVVVYGGAQWIGRRDVALTDDAYQYLGAAQVYKAWYIDAFRSVVGGRGGALRQDAIDRHFQVNNVHPPMAKALMAAGIAILHDRLQRLDEIEAARVGVLCLSTLLAAMMFLTCWPVYGPAVAVAAPLFLLVMPRFFFDSHIESLDVASAATYFMAVFCFWQSRRHDGWAVAAALAAGLAMSTKVNGVLVVVPLTLAWWFDIFRSRAGWRDALRRLAHPPPALLLMIAMGPIVAILLWPWLWGDTIRRLSAYVAFYVHHHPSLFYYFGTIYYVPFAPWHAPLVMAAITTPVPILVLAAIGVAIVVRRQTRQSNVEPDARALDALVILNALVTIGAVALPNVPKYGGVKLFLPFFPFLAILAAVGFDAAANAAAVAFGIGARWRAAASAAVLAALIGSMGWTLAHIHPYELSYYNAMIGGLRGADRLGFETQYYDLWYLELARWLNRTYPDGVHVFFQPNNPEYLRHAAWYYEAGRLNRNVVIVRQESDADIVVLTHERRWPQYGELRERFRTHRARHELVVEGVPLLTVYDAKSSDE